MVVLEEPRSDQTLSGRPFRGAAESVAGADLPRAGERAVQNHGNREVERLKVVP